jgi:multidrug resistance efflux pump
MSETEFRRRLADRNSPVPYRAAEGLQITTTSKAQGGGRNHFVRGRTGEICQLGEEEYFIFSLLDGRPSFADVQREFRDRFAGELSRRHFQGFIDELLTAGIIERLPGAPLAEEVEEAPPGGPSASPPDRGGSAADTAPLADVPPAHPGRPGLAPLFLLLARLGSPVRFFAWLLIPATAMAGWALFGAEGGLRPMIAAMDWTGRLGAIPWQIPIAAFDAVVALLVVLLVPSLVAGAAASFHGAPRETFQFRTTAVVLPRFPLDPRRVRLLTRKGQAWTYAAAILARLFLFVVGAAVWATHRNEGGHVALTGYLLAEFGLWTFLLSATPLWSWDGRRFLAAYFDEPMLDRPPGAEETRRSRPIRGHGFLVCGILIGLAAMVGSALPWLPPLVSTLPPATVPILLWTSYGAALIWLLAARSSVEPLVDLAPGGIYARKGGSPFAPGAGLADEATLSGPVSLSDRLRAGSTHWPSNRTPLFLALLIAALIAVAFLPYPYESGGSFTVMPFGRTGLMARVSGEITEVLVREGEWVNEGQVVATLSDWNEVHELSLAQAGQDQAMAELQNLLISPKPEEVEVARRQYEQALSRLPYSKSQYERYLALVKTNDVSVSQFELALSTYQQDQAAVAVTKANFDYVRVGPTQAQIAAARAAVQHATDQVSFWKDQLGRTRIRATASGQVVTPDPQLAMGQYLQAGSIAITLEDHRVAHVEVLVPENDIRDIHLGSLVRAKAWGYEYTMWDGKTVLIAPDAQANGTMGNVIRVIAEIPNPDGLLRPNMTGDAKVETVDMPVWMSFTRAIVRFFLIEVWYWIP